MKPKDIIHQYFRKKVVLEKEVCECQFCDVQYRTVNATRMKQHILVCKKSPDNVKALFRPASSTELEPVALAALSDSNGTGSRNEEIDGAIARAIYVSGSPLCMLEHPLWVEALNKLNAEYTPPGRKRLSTVLLDSEYNMTKDRIETTINNSEVLHLATDGWSNVRNDGILNIMIFTPKPHFYSFVETKANRHTGDYLMSELTKVIEDLGPTKFTAIVTDNAANMKRCGTLLEEKYPHIMWNGCLAHTLHLHVKDVLQINSITKLLQKVKSIIKMIKKSQILTASFQQTSKEKQLNGSLHLPVKTRWASYSQCLNSFISAKVVMQNMVVNGNDLNTLFTRKYKQQILDDDFWQKVNQIRDFFEPITKWIRILEGDYSSVHKVHKCILEVNENLNTEIAHNIMNDNSLEALKQKFEERRETALKPIHFAASILDPNNKGCALSGTENIDGCEVMLKIFELIDTSPVTEMFHELSQYKDQEGLWGRQFVINMADKMSPISWWNSFFAPTKLGKIANKILTVPATSAAVERSFSSFANIHTKKRNKLTTERAGKITLISHNWRIINKPFTTKATPTAGCSRDQGETASRDADEGDIDEDEQLSDYSDSDSDMSAASD